MYDLPALAGQGSASLSVEDVDAYRILNTALTPKFAEGRKVREGSESKHLSASGVHPTQTR